jgi:hypothetical protein
MFSLSTARLEHQSGETKSPVPKLSMAFLPRRDLSFNFITTITTSQGIEYDHELKWGYADNIRIPTPSWQQHAQDVLCCIGDMGRRFSMNSHLLLSSDPHRCLSVDPQDTFKSPGTSLLPEYGAKSKNSNRKSRLGRDYGQL